MAFSFSIFSSRSAIIIAALSNPLMIASEYAFEVLSIVLVMVSVIPVSKMLTDQTVASGVASRET